MDSLVSAIMEARVVRLGYKRLRDDVVSLHYVAPVDIRLYEDPTRPRLHLWAYCFDERRLERHLLERIVSVHDGGESFSPRQVLDLWPTGWALPEAWAVPRVGNGWELGLTARPGMNERSGRPPGR